MAMSNPSHAKKSVLISFMRSQLPCTVSISFGGVFVFLVEGQWVLCVVQIEALTADQRQEKETLTHNRRRCLCMQNVSNLSMSQWPELKYELCRCQWDKVGMCLDRTSLQEWFGLIYTLVSCRGARYAWMLSPCC